MTAPPLPTPSPSSFNPDEVWNDLTEWIGYWYQDADFDALRIALCATVTHYYPQEKPLWLLIIGNSGSGKTELVIQALKDLPETHVISKLTPSCFLSAREKGGRKNSLLFRHGDSQIWLFKDFTTFVSMRQDARTEVAAQLREIWDGEMISETGSGDSLEWHGKVTSIAVATPEFEHHWGALRGLGERFTTVRWRTGNAMAAMDKSRAQPGNEDLIRETIKKYVMELFVNRRTDTRTMPSNQWMKRIDYLALVVAKLRTNIPRDTDSGRSVSYIPEPEFPMRISLALSQIVRTHMDLFHHAIPGDTEFNLARRLALDTIPRNRLSALQCIPHTGEITCGSILYTSRIPRTSLQRIIEDLEILDILESVTNTSDWSNRSVRLHPDFRDVLDSAQTKLHHNVVKMAPKRGRKPSSNPDKARYSDEG